MCVGGGIQETFRVCVWGEDRGKAGTTTGFQLCCRNQQQLQHLGGLSERRDPGSPDLLGQNLLFNKTPGGSCAPPGLKALATVQAVLLAAVTSLLVEDSGGGAG